MFLLFMEKLLWMTLRDILNVFFLNKYLPGVSRGAGSGTVGQPNSFPLIPLERFNASGLYNMMNIIFI